MIGQFTPIYPRTKSRCIEFNSYDTTPLGVDGPLGCTGDKPVDLNAPTARWGSPDHAAASNGGEW